MKTSAILVSACATLALATPVVVKREIKTEVVFQYVTITVTGTGPSPTAEPTVEPTTEAPVVEPTTEPTVEPTVVESTEDQTGTPGAFFSAPASPEPEAPAISVPEIDTSNLSPYALPILTQHNLHRANHSAAPLEWDDYLVNAAQMLADTCVYGHDTKIGGGGYGQNIGADSIGPDNVPGMITNGMYNNEMINYHSYGGEPNSGDLGSYGHFTQIVWKGSTKVGCATAKCGSMTNQEGQPMNGFTYFSVCNYSPPGNYIGQYADNVGEPLGEATISL